jgi:hypothetical protein
MYAGEGIGGVPNDYLAKRERVMQLQEIDTLQDLKVWVEENMQGATVEEGEGGILIRTNLGSTMGGYLYEREGE